ncbi:nitrogenase molybdenum-iron protein subunit beta [Protofrankia symbiont of Coriaria ruscifolia]|uniref:Nitrogenase molybdenum-iron protein beta chain n=4 Tax=Frankiaceae TaxID=74712 RepID=A0A1C3P4N2_9ACTN|nr:nitrogenase molybdenum-iron protein subunit beta [Protofrankia symbiont of Coriaria ruscifolia]SBW24782.1 Nitrogenase molybdenum-iron protein beta chain [Candidatus Protofrankia californiensis]
MSTSPDALTVRDHNTLFNSPEYQEQRERKKQFEGGSAPEEVARVAEWTRSWEYREKNFARQHLTVNPLKACQPLGAVLAALGFAGTLPLVHGSQGCTSYFRGHLSRHFKEPVPTVSSSMTEDSAVFGGLSNLIEALGTSVHLYKPDMVAVSTTCMAEVIGDDLQNFIASARTKGAITEDIPVPYAHTPSFVGSHVLGYDNMLRGILSYLTEGKKSTSNGTINIVPGFDPYVGNIREIKRLLTLLGIKHVVLGDHSDSLDSPATGEYHMYPGGTPLAVAGDSINADATVFLQALGSKRTKEIVNGWAGEAVMLNPPIGIANTDTFVTEVARVAGVEVPDEITAERGRLLDAMTDSHAYLHGKRVAIAGDPDFVNGMLGFLLEMGMEPIHVVSSNGDATWAERAKGILAASPFGAKATVWPGKDAWHLRSLVFTEPVDLIVGPTHLKHLAREANVQLFRAGFPIFDRHHLHRFPIYGYAGGLHLLTQLVNSILDEVDRNAPDHSFDIVR